MSDKESDNNGGLGFFSVLAIIFITLKILGHITWSWWWVLSPIWIGTALTILLWFVLHLIFDKH